MAGVNETFSTAAPSSVVPPEDEMSTVEPDLAARSSGIPLIFVPLGLVVAVIMLSAGVFLMVRKRRLDRLRHHLMPLYNFDPAEEGEDWEAELLDEGPEHRVGRKGYKSTVTETTELFAR
ncbi:uncharacterized protein C3orf18 homolog [Bacillus rossius redtenbacheri]|uniref:uncharacterized protein C3orf18 homolog n=1 Tax=Bacillus rossius redtenbacheri TaxID=93214 RepID=UPI002FDD2095